ncbi:MAG TPA: sensor histidine kinase [Bryobacteraceae bacterium]|nr:sensor histidine kinase [Bryobacteraceae bacterium]
MASNSITQGHLQRLLLLGLGLFAVLLLSAVLVAFRTVHQLDKNTKTFADRLAMAKAAIDGIQHQQADLNAQWLQLAKKDVVSRAEILDQLEESRDDMSDALKSAYEQAELLRESIYQEGHGLLRLTVWLFALCVGLSLVSATWAAKASAGLFRKLEQQAGELSRMQYQFLETQENVARRFSHELHDELGQALTAVKANLSALRREDGEKRRLDDCLLLVDGAIKDVREMSQLLRPTILDDFGIDAALGSLTESFAQRTGIDVKYRSNIDGGRLRDQTETNLFRIAQEALTNVARHAEATSVFIELLTRGPKEVTLSIRDNGKGFESGSQKSSPGLGLAGMQTRARGCDGWLSVEAAPGKGVKIQVSCPNG